MWCLIDWATHLSHFFPFAHYLLLQTFNLPDVNVPLPTDVLFLSAHLLLRTLQVLNHLIQPHLSILTLDNLILAVLNVDLQLLYFIMVLRVMVGKLIL